MEASNSTEAERPLHVAVIGGGISGLSAAWLLAQRHRVTLFEAQQRLGGHSNTVEVAGIPVDTGFIVYNEATYPNLAALLHHLQVPTKPSDMSFAVSLDGGRLEYSGSGLSGVFAQRSNAFKPRFLGMLRDLLRFYREAPRDAGRLADVSLDDYLAAAGYGRAFRDDHLLPMAAAIWSTPAADIGTYPAAAFIRFCENHGLLKLSGRPVWRTVEGGSRRYVERLAVGLDVVSGRPVRSVRRLGDGVEIMVAGERARGFDHVVMATHADTTLALLADPTAEERRLLGAFGYVANDAVLHSDVAFMPRRRRVWSSWNYLAGTFGETRQATVTYWMNRLQGIDDAVPLFVTLNPDREPRAGTLIRRETYHHPAFDAAAMRAQDEVWDLQGRRNTWFCGAYFGAGFHEDGLQAGLAVAEALGGVRRPWTVAAESGRIHRRPPRPHVRATEPA